MAHIQTTAPNEYSASMYFAYHHHAASAVRGFVMGQTSSGTVIVKANRYSASDSIRMQRIG